MTTKSRAEGRPVRVPIAKSRTLAAEQREGFVRRWVNEEPGRVERFKQAGYTVVLDDKADTSDQLTQTESKLGSVARKVVNKDYRASTQTAVLMEIPEEFYKEDQQAKMDDLDRLEMGFDPENIKKRNPALYGEMTKTYS